MTLRELITANPDRFYKQTWYLAEAFPDIVLPERPKSAPHAVVALSPEGRRLPRAGTVAQLFLADPTSALWSHFIWCADRDGKGRRIYVGGVCKENGFTFEIHRHLHLTAQWGVLTWD